MIRAVALAFMFAASRVIASETAGAAPSGPGGESSPDTQRERSESTREASAEANSDECGCPPPEESP